MKTLQMNPVYSNFLDRHLNPLMDESPMPVIKIDFRAQLMYANKAAIEFLINTGGIRNGRAISYIIAKNPGLLNPDCVLDINIRSGDLIYHFSAIGFREGGYVGLYGYEIETL